MKVKNIQEISFDEFNKQTKYELELSDIENRVEYIKPEDEFFEVKFEDKDGNVFIDFFKSSDIIYYKNKYYNIYELMELLK